MSTLLHREFHKTASTGMKVGKKYKVYSTLTKSGTYLENPDDDRDVHTLVGVSDQELDADKKRELYDMRGKKGCFTVMMFGEGTIGILAFKPESCLAG